MVRLVFSAILFLSLIGCAGTRTKYQPMTKSGGYADKELGKGVIVSRFAGNAYTNSDDAKLLSGFRAVEVCREKGFKLARIYGMENKSTSQTVQKSSNYSYTTPTYITGTANSNTNYNMYGNTLNARTNTAYNAQVTGGQTYGGTNSWNETYHYPTFDVTYSCVNHVYLMGIELKAVENSEVKAFSKDTLGALVIGDFVAGSPNEEALQVGDVILKVNGRRIVNVGQMHKQIEKAKNKSSIPLTIVREGKVRKARAQAEDKSWSISKMNEDMLNGACKAKEIMSRPVCKSFRGISSVGK